MKRLRIGLLCITLLLLAVVGAGSVFATGAKLSATGSPRSTLLSQQPTDTPDAPGPDIPVPIAGGCWMSSDLVVLDSGQKSFLKPPANILDPALEYSAQLHTSLGTIEIELGAQSAPDAVNNFVCLANAGFYDGTPFFRAIPGLLIQGGDPTGTGTGNPGYTFSVDTTQADYSAGVIAFANFAPDQNGSQFFITASNLNGSIATDFPVFGRVVDGMDVVEAISESNIQATYASPAANQPGVAILESAEIVAHPPVSGPFITPAVAATTKPTTVSAVGSVVAAGAIELDAKDIAFVPTELTISASDEPVTIKMVNTGAALHNFSIDALKIDVDVNPGETVDIVIPAGTAPGTYDFYCNVPGHKEAGMVGKLVVK